MHQGRYSRTLFHSWLFLEIGDPFSGCPRTKTPTMWDLFEVPVGLPDFWKLPHSTVLRFKNSDFTLLPSYEPSSKLLVDPGC